MIATRGCGDRLAGGAYLCSGQSEGGVPVEQMLIDPPQRIEPREFGLTPRGTVLVEKHGVVHVLDWVGSDTYPNVADFIEEARRLGVSRRIAKNADFSRLTDDSRLILVHARAWIENAGEYQMARPEDEFWCPRDIETHMSNCYREMCAALWWEDVEEGVPTRDPAAPNGVLCGGMADIPGLHMHRRRTEGRAVVRQMPAFSYRAFARPEWLLPRYAPAAFASFPITAIEVVRDHAGGTHQETLRRATMARLPVRLEEE